MIRVVTALFIKETLASAANDAEMVIEESRRMAVEYQERLEAGDGNIWLIYIYMIEGGLEVKLPTIWTVEKQR